MSDAEKEISYLNKSFCFKKKGPIPEKQQKILDKLQNNA